MTYIVANVNVANVNVEFTFAKKSSVCVRVKLVEQRHIAFVCSVSCLTVSVPWLRTV